MATETAAERGAVVQQILADTSGEASSVREAALQAVIPPPPGTTVGFLWKALVIGLLILIGIALVGVLWTVLDGDSATDSDKALIAFTPLLSGLLGLFITSPTGGSGG